MRLCSTYYQREVVRIGFSRGIFALMVRTCMERTLAALLVALFCTYVVPKGYWHACAVDHSEHHGNGSSDDPQLKASCGICDLALQVYQAVPSAVPAVKERLVAVISARPIGSWIAVHTGRASNRGPPFQG